MNQPNQPAQVQDKAQKPQGLLPKNVQSWLLIGLAFLMVAIMWLTGGKKPQTPAKAASSATLLQAPLEVNETKIAEMQNRIQDLQRQQLVAQSALAQQTRLLGATPQDSQQSQQQSASGNPPDQRAEDPIQAERKRRAYVSLFASNVALTYRKTPSTPPSAPAPEPEVRSCRPEPRPRGTRLPSGRATLERDASESGFNRAGTSLPCQCATIPRKQPRIERRKTEILPPYHLAPPMRRQEKPTYSLKEPFSKPFSSTASTGASQVPSSACSQPTFTRTTVSTC